MTWRHVLIAWVVAACAVGLGWLSWRGTAPRRTHAVIEPPIPADSVDWLELERGDGSTLSWRREGHAWEQVEPFAVPIDTLAVRSAIDAILSLESSRSVPAEEVEQAPGRLGLGTGAPRIRLRAGAEAVELVLGRRAPAGRAWVAVGESAQAENVPAILHDMLLTGDPRDWRDTRLFRGSGSGVERVHALAMDVRTGSVLELDLVRAGRHWRIEKPLACRGNDERIEALVDALGRARGSAFLVDNPADLAPFGLEDPVAAVEVVSRQSEAAPDGKVEQRERVERVLVGQQVRAGQPDRYAMIDGVPAVLALDGTTVASLLPDVASLVSPLGCGVDPVDVGAIEVSPAGGDSFRLERKGAAWLVKRPDGVESPASPAEVAALLARLCAEPASEVAIQSAPEGLVKGSISLVGFDGRPLARIRVAREEGERGKWALDDGEGVLRVHPAANGIALTPEAYLGR